MKHEIGESDIIFMSKTEISKHTAEYLHSNGPNSWKDWWCSAGLRSLYISHDGLIYRGTCQVDGVIGSIYNTGSPRAVELSQWVKCTADTCMCAPDMRAPKVVNIENSNIVGMTHQYLPKAYWVNNAEVDLVNDPYVTYSQAHEEFKLVIWELGRRCNYDCWYCGPDAHNTYESQKTLGSLLAAVRQLQIIWLNSQPAKFVFAGGESTFNPDFMEFANHLHKDGHRIHTTTNGSHTTAYYTELARISDISFSAHLSYLETPNIAKKFIANVAAATINAGLNYIEVRIMLQPGKLLQAQELHTRLIEVTPRVTVDLLHNETKTTIEYTAQEVQWATSHQ